MMKILTPLLTTTSSRIRHIRTAFASKIMRNNEPGDLVTSLVGYFTVFMLLKKLPSLSLDTLVIVGLEALRNSSYHKIIMYVIDLLIKYGNGFKELHFVGNALFDSSSLSRPDALDIFHELLGVHENRKPGVHVRLYQSLLRRARLQSLIRTSVTTDSQCPGECTIKTEENNQWEPGRYCWSPDVTVTPAPNMTEE
jgi:hypothetical protein